MLSLDLDGYQKMRATEVCGMEPLHLAVKAERQGTPRLYCEF